MKIQMTALVFACLSGIAGAQPPADNNTRPDTPGTGRFPAMKEEVRSLPAHVVYRPADLSALGTVKLGVVAWGNGGCAEDGASSRFHLLEIASHGYLVIASGRILSGPGAPPRERRPPAQPGQILPPQTKASDLSDAIDWALAENQRSGSPYFGRIDPALVAYSGWSCGGLQALQVAKDPRVKTMVLHNTGVLNDGPGAIPGMDVRKDVLATLHTPVIYILGGPKDIAYTNGMDDFARIAHVPVAAANLPVGHGGTFLEPNGGAAASVAVSWLEWQLRGDTQSARRFVGENCGLCGDAQWLLERKQFPMTAAVAQAPPSRSIDEHIAAARTAAGLDYRATFVNLCLPSAPPAGRGRGVAPAVPATPDRANWYAPPFKVFDNLYWLGTRQHSSWALQTSAGLIILDTNFAWATEPEIIAGLTTLGLNPRDIKYVIISHAHGDHDQGAAELQKRYGAQVVMGTPDWDVTVNRPATAAGGVPTRGIAVGPEGTTLTLGDTALQIAATPGHTPGTLSYVFPVKNQGRVVRVAYSGGTLTGAFGTDGARWDEYIASQRKIAKLAADAGASVILSNHSEYDGAYTKARLLAAPRQPGEDHPFIVGTDGVQRYFTVMAECATASKLRAGATP